MDFISYIHELNIVSILIRMGMAIACGGVLGLERRKSGHAAGMRTYMLVALGSAIVSMTSQYMYNFFTEERPDAQRLGAAVISGSAVLAALVVSKHSTIKGLTTAVSMWVSSCMGLAIGIGFYWVGILGTAAVFLIMTVLYRVETGFLLKSSTIGLNIEADSKNTLLDVARNLEGLGIKIEDIKLDTGKTNDDRESIFYDDSENTCVGEFMVQSKKLNQNMLLREVVSMDGVYNAWYSR